MDSAPSERLAAVRQRIATAAQKAGRNPDDVTLLAVTKTVSWERLIPWIDAGLREFGENRVQEALGKFLTPTNEKKVAARFHLIGPLQTNKAKKAVSFFDVVQSLDRLDLAEVLDRCGEEAGRPITCLAQVKLSTEPTKSGLSPETLPEFLAAAKRFSHLRVDGLMGIPPIDATGDKARPYFARLRRLFEDAKLRVLSMGMSSDFEVAVEEGATLVRLGSVLFGARS